MITKMTAGSGNVRVTFWMPKEIRATTFYVVGEFNNWDKTATPMQQTQKGWVASVELEPNRAYQYRFLVDGRWVNDWSADQYVPNEFGGDNSVVVTTPVTYAPDVLMPHETFAGYHTQRSYRSIPKPQYQYQSS